MPRHIVRWTTREARKIATALLDEGYKSEDRGLGPRIAELQIGLLASDRQRPKTGLSSHDSYKIVTEAMRSLEYERKARAASVPEPEPLAVEAFAPPPAIEPGLDHVLDALARQLASRFIVHLRAAFEEALEGQLLPKMNVKQRKPRVLVVGLKGSQVQIINGEFSAFLDLRFIESDANPASIKGRIGTVDKVIGFTDFMSHSQEDHLKPLPHYERVGGGLDRLRSVLNSTYQQFGTHQS